jgi:hypothetical protein
MSTMTAGFPTPAPTSTIHQRRRSVAPPKRSGESFTAVERVSANESVDNSSQERSNDTYPPRPSSALGHSSSKPQRHSHRDGERTHKTHKRGTSVAPDPRQEKIERVKRRLGEGFPVDMVFPDNYDGLSSGPTSDDKRKSKSAATPRAGAPPAARPPWLIASVDFPPVVPAHTSHRHRSSADSGDSADVPLLKSRRHESKKDRHQEKLMVVVGMQGLLR